MSLLKANKILIIQLQPWILCKLFSFSATNFSNQELSLADVDKDFTNTLEELLESLDSASEIITKVKQLITAKLNFNDFDERFFAAWKMMIMNKGNLRIDNIAEDINISTRRLEQLYKDAIGFSPKLYGQVVRFQKSLFDHVVKNESLLRTPLSYFDQAHFIRNVKRFTGMTPTQLSRSLSHPVQRSTCLNSNLYVFE